MLIGALLAVLAVAAVVVVATRSDDQPSAHSFCFLLRLPDVSVQEAREAITGTQPADSSLDLTGLRAFGPSIYTDDVVSGAPAELRDDARTVRDALRRAVAEGDEAPLDEPATAAAVERLATDAPAHCPAPA